MKKFEELEITDDYMFKRVFSDKYLVEKLLELLLEIEIDQLMLKTEDAFQGSNNRIQIDVNGRDGTVYDIELVNQCVNVKATSLGREGAKKYIIVLCVSDPFGKNYKRYDFASTLLDQTSGAELNLETAYIFLNAKGVHGTLPADIEALLNYMNHSNEQMTSYVQELDHHLRKWKQRDDARMKYMALQDVIMRERAEGLVEGKALERMTSIVNLFDICVRFMETEDAIHEVSVRYELTVEEIEMLNER